MQNADVRLFVGLPQRAHTSPRSKYSTLKGARDVKHSALLRQAPGAKTPPKFRMAQSEKVHGLGGLARVYHGSKAGLWLITRGLSKHFCTRESVPLLGG